MKIESKRFGMLEVKEDRILKLNGGLFGFSHMTRFALMDDQEDPNLPFKWLISVDDPEYGFLVTDPGIFFKDYVFDLSEDDRREIGASTEDDITVINMLTIPADPRRITANLRGPLVFNNRTMTGKQIILENTGYATKHYIFIQTADTEAATAAKASAAVPAAKIVGAGDTTNTDVKTHA